MKIHYRLKLNKEQFFWFVMLVPLLKTNGIVTRYPVLNRLNDILAALVVLILLVYILAIKKNSRNKDTLASVIVFLAYMFVNTILRTVNANYKAVVLASIYYIGIVMYIIVLSDRPYILIKSFLLNLELLVYLNFITLLLYPNGIYLTDGGGSCWILGYDNWWYILFYAAFFLAIVNYRYFGQFFRMLLLLIVLHTSAIIRMSGVLVFGIFLLDILIFTNLYRRKIIRFETIWGVGLIANILLIFFYSSGFVVFVMNLLRRPYSTLLVRTRIWNTTLAAIGSNLVFGVGREMALQRQKMYGLIAGVNAHNMWLEILYEGGLVGVLLFALVIVVVGKHVIKIENTDFKQLLLVCILTSIIGLSVDSVLLDLRGTMFIALLGIAGSIDTISLRLEKEKNSLRYPIKKGKHIVFKLFKKEQQ